MALVGLLRHALRKTLPDGALPRKHNCHVKLCTCGLLWHAPSKALVESALKRNKSRQVTPSAPASDTTTDIIHAYPTFAAAYACRYDGVEEGVAMTTLYQNRRRKEQDIKTTTSSRRPLPPHHPSCAARPKKMTILPWLHQSLP